MGSLGRSLFAIIAAATLIQHAQQQQLQQTLSKEQILCAADNTENTLRSFWNDVSSDPCPLDPHQLINLYEDVSAAQGKKNGSAKCNTLLGHNIRKSLIEASAVILEEAIIDRSFNSCAEVKRLTQRLSQLDWRISEAIWMRAIDAVYLFADILQLNVALNQLDLQTRIVSLMQLYAKPLRLDADDFAKLAVQKALFLNNIHSDVSEFRKLPLELVTSLRRMFSSWPQELRHLYNAVKFQTQHVALLNTGHWEYLYVPRYIGPNDNQRLPLTWSKYKNETDSDCDLYLTFNGMGEVSLGNRFYAIIKYLYVDDDDNTAYWWIGEGIKPNRWWHINWYEKSDAGGDYYTFANTKTAELLCATMLYDSDKRIVTLSAKPKKGVNASPECRWKFRWSDVVAQNS